MSSTEDVITLRQKEYRNSLDDIRFGDNENPNRELNPDEYKQFRGMVGKIQWLSEGTRPDLAFHNNHEYENQECHNEGHEET